MPIGLQWDFVYLFDQVDIDASHKDRVFKWPQHILDVSDHILVGGRGFLKLTFVDFHPQDLVVVVKPNSLGGLFDANYLLKRFFSTFVEL